MDKHIVASIYEISREREKAIMIYRQILLQNPSDTCSENALRRLVDNKHVQYTINKDMLDCFMDASSNFDSLNKFERWLIGN